MIPSSLISSINNIIWCIQQTCGQKNFLLIKTLDVSIQQDHGYLILEAHSSGFRVTEGLWGFSPGKMCDIKSQVYNSLLFSRKFLSDERSARKCLLWTSHSIHLYFAENKLLASKANFIQLIFKFCIPDIFLVFYQV